jgi:hypothetical protein
MPSGTNELGKKENFARGLSSKGKSRGPLARRNPNWTNETSIKPAPKETIVAGYDRSGHQPGNPGFNREGKPPYKEYDAGAHAKQPRGHPIGAGTPSTKPPIANIKAEGSKPMGEVAHTGPKDRGSRLVEQPNGPGNHKQPQGHSIGAGTRTARVGESMGKGSGAFRGMTSNPLRCHNGGHRIGAREK